jgi:hypothetical protein
VLAALDVVPDPRKPRGVWHQINAILTLAVCAVMAGCRSSPQSVRGPPISSLTRTFTDCCLITLDEDEARTLCETLTEWLG